MTGSLAAALLVLLLLGYSATLFPALRITDVCTAGHQSMVHPNSHLSEAAEESRHTPCSAWLHVYLEHSSVEIEYLISTVLADTRSSCGVCIRLRDRDDFAKDLDSSSSTCHAMLLMASMDIHEHEVAAMRANAEKARERVIVFQLSDEHEDKFIPEGGLDLPRLLLRNYYSEAKDRLVDLTYLQADDREGGPVELGNYAAGRGPGHPPARRLWTPLGHTNNFSPGLRRSLNIPTRDRPYGWSWAGGKSGKWAREYFLNGLDAHPHKQEIMEAGKLRVYGQFMDAASGMMGGVQYSSWLYESRLAPCPNGGSAEQFRVWEALEAGAVPLVPSNVHPHHLVYLFALDYRVLWIDQSRWHLDAGDFLLNSKHNETFVEELAVFQEHNARVLRDMYKRLKYRIGAEVCAAAGLPCTGSKRGQCPNTAAASAPACTVTATGGGRI